MPLTPASTGVRRTTGSTSLRHLDDDLVGVAVGEHAGERTAARHAVAARVVDDDQVDAARFLALGGQAGAGAAADDGLAARDHAAKLVEDRACVGMRAIASVSSVQRAPARGRTRDFVEGGHQRRRESFVVHVTAAGGRACDRCRPRNSGGDRVEQRAIRRRDPRTACRARRAPTAPPSGNRKRTGPCMRLSLPAMNAPMRAHSSAVVRISVTFGLCR